ncbi:MAG TPA: hypothetical protein VHG92_06875 [Afifellaceae bacterium]|nr:hypothetical protein [Afifellaceae bacterium]
MLLAGATAAAAGSATSAVTSYPPPPVPSCDAVLARGGQGIWVGNYSGRFKTQSKHGTAPYGATGCFLSEAECRQWLHQNMSFAGEPMYVMSCRPATGGIARY